MIKSIAIAAGTAAALSAASVAAQPNPVRNVVLVHGAFADGAGWRGVYDELTGRGYKVSIVQNPLTSFEDDVAATRRVLARQDGPAILVGHSYGGTVITEAGVDPKVAGLVYVAASLRRLASQRSTNMRRSPLRRTSSPMSSPTGSPSSRPRRFALGSPATRRKRTPPFCAPPKCPLP
jgi:pimeloyl-ACP methyl ester carboxylesterase